jgi:hypothetical protein
VWPKWRNRHLSKLMVRKHKSNYGFKHPCRSMAWTESWRCMSSYESDNNIKRYDQTRRGSVACTTQLWFEWLRFLAVQSECSLIWIMVFPLLEETIFLICFHAGICIDTIPSAHCCIMNFNWLLPGAVINQELLARAIHTRTYYNVI